MTATFTEEPPTEHTGPKVWGVDIGGANLKLCSRSGRCASVAFPMWTESHRLAVALQELMRQLAGDGGGIDWDDDSVMAVTMTGELADCFESRRVGVAKILDQVSSIVPDSQCRIYSVKGQWLSPSEAKAAPWSVAASNWHALASWCLSLKQLGNECCRAIVDIGSTTVDIIPVGNGRVFTNASTDRQRMELGQLVYTGMERTPVHAIVRSLRVDKVRCPVMAERFATVSDANLILGASVEEEDNCDTADGRPRTRKCALARLARMVGEDGETLSEDGLIRMANQVVAAQTKQVSRALCRNLPARPDEQNLTADNRVLQQCRVLVSGHGRVMVERLKKTSTLNHVQFFYLEDSIGLDAARCAPAMAVAELWRSRSAPK